MAASTNPSLTSLLGRSSLDDHEGRLAASETVLKSTAANIEAQHVKAVALLKLDRFKDAVALFEKAGTDLKEAAGLEYAYALYKVGNLELAAETASKIPENRGAQHVEAQARYRLEHYTKTAQLYAEVRRTTSSAEDYDLKVNQGAIDAQGQWLGLLEASAARRPDRDDLAAFETAYNAACGSIARGELSQAEVLLKRARTLCQHSEELTDEQKKEELLPILVQQVYVLYKQGKIKEAETVEEEIKIEDIADMSTKKIAINNQLINPEISSNPFTIHKAFNSAPSVPESDQLFSYQSLPLLSNEKTIDLKSYKFGALARTSKRKSSKASSQSTSSEGLLLSTFEAAALAKNDVGCAAVKRILPELQRQPSNLGLIMTMAQMYIQLGNTTSAIELVENYAQRLATDDSEDDLEVRYNPGLVSVLTALYKVQGRKEHIRRELAKAASYWRQKQRPPITLLRAAGISLLESSTLGDVQSASEIFDKLYEEQPSDKATIAGYVASHALTDPESVKSLAGQLKPVSDLVAGIDVDALESAGIPQAFNALAIAQAGSSRKRTNPNGAEVRQRKRVRTSRLPKDYDPNSETKPDPERWLPMRDRSYYRAPKGKKKGKKGDERTQGGAVSEDLDVSKQPQKGSEVVGSGSGGAKKKKAKGKK